MNKMFSNLKRLFFKRAIPPIEEKEAKDISEPILHLLANKDKWEVSTEGDWRYATHVITYREESFKFTGSYGDSYLWNLSHDWITYDEREAICSALQIIWQEKFELEERLREESKQLQRETLKARWGIL